MGRHGAVASSLPPAAVQSPPAMPPMPPMPHMPPKKRYLMENPPAPGGLIQLAEVSSLPRRPPPGGDLTNYQHQLNGHGPPPNGLNGLNGLRHRVEYDPAEPLNLTTASNHEVQLSRIVDKVVEKMLKTGEKDDCRQGDPLRLWFTNQFETKQRNECPSSGGTPSPRHKSVSPQLPSPTAAGSPGRPSPGLVPPGTDSGTEQPPPAGRPDAEPDTGVMELTIGMSDTINRVIDNVYRRDRRSTEVSSCSSDCVGSTTPPEPPPPPPPPPAPPGKQRRCPPAGGGRERARVKRASAAAGAGAAATPAKRNRAAASTVTASSIASAAATTVSSVTSVTPAGPAESPASADRLSAAVASDEEDTGGHGLVIDESPSVGVGADHSPDSRSGRSPPVLEPGSPRRRNRKRNTPADIRIGDAKLADSTASPNRGSRKRKVGKEDIVRIQKDGDNGLDPSSLPMSGKDKSKSQPK